MILQNNVCLKAHENIWTNHSQWLFILLGCRLSGATLTSCHHAGGAHDNILHNRATVKVSFSHRPLTLLSLVSVLWFLT